MLNTAIVITTYNGEKYIVEQLESIRLQTRTPNHVYIFDDKSTDSTPKRIEEYIEKYSLQNEWELFVNEKQFGWKRNFMEGFKKANEELVFPCDQDDIWPTYKVEYYADIFEKNEKIALLRGRSVSINKRYFSFSLDKCVLLDRFGTNEFGKSARGCSLCFRKSFFDIVEKHWEENQPHDAFLIHMARLMNVGYRTQIVGVYHRVHNNNTFTNENKSKNYRRDALNKNEERRVMCMLMKHFLHTHPEYDDNKKNNAIAKIENWISYRERYLINPNILMQLGLIKYFYYYESYKPFLKDVFMLYFEMRKKFF